MTLKTSTIKEEVYNHLKSLKRENERFSQLLQRLAEQINGQNLQKFFGKWDIDDDEMKNIDKKLNIFLDSNKKYVKYTT